MSWTDWVSLVVFILGFAFFLYGSNTYNAIFGWTGAFLYVGAVAFFLLRHVYLELTKKKPAPVQNP
jgi:hypothetical protein